MIKAETGAVLFACTGVEPRQGQTLVVVGSSAELGGGDASRGVTLHQLKNPAFSSVWMSFPICHSACSNVRFQFALVGPGLDSVESGASASGGVPLIAGASLVEGVQNSSAVTSSALPSAVPTDDRSHDCHGYVTLCEPLGCGLREMEVVDGGLVLFGGRWGEGGTQVTPLTWNDMVTAQQQLEQDASPSVSAKSDSERERVREREGTGDRENFGGLPERGMRGSSFTVGDGVVVSAAPLTFAFSEREGERERKNGEGRAVQSEAEFSSNRRSTLSVQQGGCGERVTLSELGVVGGGGVVPITAKEGILMASVDSAQRGGASVSGGRPETSEYVSTQARGDEVMEERRRYGNSDQAVRFAPAAVKKRGWVGGKGGDLSGGKTAESVNGLAGCDGSVLIVRDGHAVSREGESVCPSAAACEGSKRRRLSSLSVAVSVSGSERRGGEEPLVTERSSVRPFPSNAGGEGRSTLSPQLFETIALEALVWEEKGRRESAQGRSRGTVTETFSVHMDGSAAVARNAEGRASVSTVGNGAGVKIAERRASVSTVDSALSAKSVEGRVSVSMVGSDLSAKIVEGRVSVSTVDCGTGAKSVEARASVSTVAGAVSAKSVEERVSVSTVGSATTARTVEGTEYVFTESSAATARSASCSQFFSIDLLLPFSFFCA
uniref:Uncharacterized protein n=1 Tax=Chromera velia CCMP2878 TaxID=1169474 RepID=A0A0G4G3V3_9ALVE|eukprot:Cvel_20103.t1-p1 / transcript=Cvel_20103.t1 / gene=Cvel_20103 / organism=Chromera_velia_CCMP2878 / gene_product=Zinc finger protein 283, putative / transcript_product=Zinc finger protein 283, putative / location=Cvel_scaffold1780:14575-16804(+) / protein_length=664 / sequence_SO=supercontig / SO=protein_coding / is_pseudo=false